MNFDKQRDTWVCEKHGDVDHTGWVNCWNGCDEGWFDDYEEDPIECEPGEISICREWRLGRHTWARANPLPLHLGRGMRRHASSCI